MPKVYQGLVHRALVFHPFKKRGVEKTRINIACRRITQVASVGGLEYNEGVYPLGYTLVLSSLQCRARARSSEFNECNCLWRHNQARGRWRRRRVSLSARYGANMEPSRFRSGSSRLIPLSSRVRFRGSSERTLGVG